MIYTPENARGATVYDMTTTPPTKLPMVIEVDTGRARVQIHDTWKSTVDVQKYTKFRRIHAFPQGARNPLLFHCY